MTKSIDKFTELGISIFLLKALLFIIIAYFGIPTLIKYLASILKLTAYYTIPNTYIALTFLMLLGFFVAFEYESIRKNKSEPVALIERIAFLLVSLSFFYLYFTGIYLKEQFIKNVFVLIGINNLLYILGIASFCLSIFGLKFFLRYKKASVTVLLTVIGFSTLSIILRKFWNVFASTVLKSTHWLLSLTATDVFIDISKNHLGVKNFVVEIGSPCSGIESFLLFTGLAIFVYIMDRQRINKKRFLIAYALGALGTFIINILRIYALILIGGYYSPELALGLFHENAGWAFFIIYFLIFAVISYKFFLKKGNGKK